MKVFFIGLLTIVMLSTVEGRQLNKHQRSLDHEMTRVGGVKQYDVAPELRQYFRNCVTIGDQKPLEQEHFDEKYKCPVEEKKSSKEKQLDAQVKELSDLYTEIDAKKTDEWKFAYSHMYDIHLGSSEDKHKSKSEEPRFRHGKNPISDGTKTKKWPVNTIFYCLDPEITGFSVLIRSGLRLAFHGTDISYLRVDCDAFFWKIRFMKVDVPPNEVEIHGGHLMGYSSIGFKGKLKGVHHLRPTETKKFQDIALRLQPAGDPVQNAGTETIAHELYHALGFLHTQQRQDRDHFITIEAPLDDINCANHAVEGYQDYGPYDYGSLMHYQETLCRADPQHTPREKGIKKITPSPEGAVNPQATVGHAVGPSIFDIKAVNEMYPPLAMEDKIKGLSKSFGGVGEVLTEDQVKALFHGEALAHYHDRAPRGPSATPHFHVPQIHGKKK